VGDRGDLGIVVASPRSRTRGLAVLVATLAVVVCEFLLLVGVYHRPDAVRRQHTTATAVTAQLTALSSLAPTASNRLAMASDLAAGTSKLADQGVSAHALAPLRAARVSLANSANSANDAAGVTAAMTAANALDRRLDRDLHRLDEQAAFFYGGLLVFASIGWFVWFRKLVRKHREFQEEVTERESRSAGERRMAALVRHASAVMTVMDAEGRLSFVTDSASEVLGRSPDAMVGTAVADLIHQGDRPGFVAQLASIRPGATHRMQLRVPHPDGRVLVTECFLTNLFAEPAVGGHTLTLRDVSERTALEAELSYQGFHDSLTGLANRRLFSDRLAHAFERRSAGAHPVYVLYGDLDELKAINDAHGQGIGDQVLAEVSRRLGVTVRGGDTVARLGGDEFGVLMEDTDEAGARACCERVLEALRDEITVNGIAIRVPISLGLAQAVPGEMTPDEALRNAEIAMVWAKDRGKDTLAMYDSRLHEEAIERLELRAALENALECDELRLHYQPQVDLVTGEIVGFEALVRWQHPEQGLLGPMSFIPLAEECGLIRRLGSWVLRTACETAARMQQPNSTPKMSVNISPWQLAQGDLLAEVTDVLLATGLAANRLVLEITETAVLQDLDAVIPALTAVRELGVRIAIDDFGTGYSSLAYLAQLPVDVLKVDKSFVDRVTTNAQDAALTEAIIKMSASMNFETVAEGVEMAEQADWLRGTACDLGQGYLWSRPVEIDVAHSLLDAQLRSIKR
jgi:diguanylate cyclase (GGDEF)-like protein/PAS domain S-box-containing protein